VKVFIICFNNETIAYPKVFLDEALAQKQLYAMQYEMDKAEGKSYSQWYSVEEMEAESSNARLPSDEQREPESSANVLQGVLSFGSPLKDFKDLILRDGAFEDEEPRKYKYRVTVEEIHEL